MANKVIYAKTISDINDLIYQHNKEGWVVKQIFVFGDAGGLGKYQGIYALLEIDGDWK